MLCLKLRIPTQDKEIGFSTNALSLYLISIFSDQMRVKTFSFFQCVNHIQVLNSSHNIFFLSTFREWMFWLLYLVLCQWHSLFLCKHFFIKVIYLSDAWGEQYIFCHILSQSQFLSVIKISMGTSAWGYRTFLWLWIYSWKLCF